YLRASTGYPRAVSYVWTLSLAASMNHFINAGVDGIIALDGNQDHLLNIVTNNHPEVRLATRADNPYQPLNEAYAIQVVTTDGTDSDIQLTLHGCQGSATITVNAGDLIPGIYSTHRFESGKHDWVTIPSKDLGVLQSITINNIAGGWYPKWGLSQLRVSSARYIGPDWPAANGVGALEYSINGNVIIEGGANTNLTLTPKFALPLPTIQCPGSVVVANDLNQCGAVANFAP